jgi:hypothetical protein
MPSRELETIKKLTSLPRLDEAHGVQLMTAIRIELERDKLKPTYNVLCMFCDWMNHPNLERCETAYEFLQDLTDVLLFFAGKTAIAPPPVEAIHREINNICGARFQVQIIDFLTQRHLPIKLFRYPRNWNAFFQVIAHNLLDRSLSFPNPKRGKAQVYYDAMVQKAAQHKLVVVEFHMSLDRWNPADKCNILYWNALTEWPGGGGVTIKGPLSPL